MITARRLDLTKDFPVGLIATIEPAPLRRRPRGVRVTLAWGDRKYNSVAWYRSGRDAIRAIHSGIGLRRFFRKTLAALATVASIREDVARGVLPESVLTGRGES